jgi:hypothetical protein
VDITGRDARVPVGDKRLTLLRGGAALLVLFALFEVTLRVSQCVGPPWLTKLARG